MSGDAGTVWVVTMIPCGPPQIAAYERVRIEQCSEDYDESSDARDGQDRTESFRADLRERTLFEGNGRRDSAVCPAVSFRSNSRWEEGGGSRNSSKSGKTRQSRKGQKGP